MSVRNKELREQGGWGQLAGSSPGIMGDCSPSWKGWPDLADECLGESLEIMGMAVWTSKGSWAEWSMVQQGLHDSEVKRDKCLGG